MVNFKRLGRLLASIFVFFALTSVGFTDEIKTITFEGQNDQDAATAVALSWMSDSSKHGPIYARHITVTNEEGKYVARIQYSDANFTAR
jgi:hypothetical protein